MASYSESGDSSIISRSQINILVLMHNATIIFLSK